MLEIKVFVLMNCVWCMRMLALLCRLYLHERKLTRARSYSFSPGPRLKTRIPDLGPAEMKNTRPSWTYSQIQLPELSLETPASADAHTGRSKCLWCLLLWLSCSNIWLIPFLRRFWENGISGLLKRICWILPEYLDGIPDSMDMSLSKLKEMVKDWVGWCAAVHGVAKSQTRRSDWTTTATLYTTEISGSTGQTLDREKIPWGID